MPGALIIVLAVFICVVPDGFDLGFGILFRRFPTGQDRDTAMNSITAVWDGNETWLVMGGGGLLAAFPVVKTSRAWAVKASFGAFWGYHSMPCAQNYFDAWTTRAMRSNLPPIKDVVGTLGRHREGLLNHSKHHTANAAAEGFNSVTQSLKAAARGFRNFENYRTRILFHCGKLDLVPVSVGSH